jgi:hypothetical protein
MAKHVVSTALVVLYGLLGLYVLLQLIMLIRQKHKPFSYKAVFNWLTLAWTVLRSVFWLLFVLEVNLQQVLFNFLFWLPMSIQYVTFALLALFLSKVVNRREWTGALRRRFLAFYGAIAVVDLSGTIILSVLAGDAATDSLSQQYGNVYSLGTAFLFLFLSFLFVYVHARAPAWLLAGVAAPLETQRR